MINCAFLVGCKEYKERGVPKLEGVDDDISGMKQALIDHCECLKENIFVIADSEEADSRPTGYEIVNTIREKAANYNRTKINLLFFYYSGHGFISNDKDPVMRPTDSLLHPFELGTLPLKRIIELIRSSFRSVRHIIIILDMCQTAPTAKDSSGEEQDISTDYLPKGLVVFRSCLPGNRSYMIPESKKELGKGSVYTAAFIDALKDDRCETVKQISAFIKHRIKYYNSEIHIHQKPFTSLQDDSLDNVVIAKKDAAVQDEAASTETKEFMDELPEDDAIPITKGELQEYQDANTIDAQLSKEQIRKVIDFADKLDLSNPIATSLLGDGTLEKIRDFYEKSTFDEIDVTFHGLEELRKFLNKSVGRNALRHFLQSFFFIVGSNTDIYIENSLKSLEKDIIDCATLYVKKASLLVAVMPSGKNCLVELAMYIISGTIALNRNKDYESTLFHKRLEKLIERYSSFSEHLQALKHETEKCYEKSMELVDCARVIDENRLQLYRDKSGTTVEERYNMDALVALNSLCDKLDDKEYKLILPFNRNV